MMGNTHLHAQGDDEIKAVKTVIQNLLRSIKAGDSDTILSSFYDDAAIMQTISTLKSVQEPLLQSSSLKQFSHSIKNKPSGMVYDERVTQYKINIDGAMASAWTPYKFFVNNQFSHCGVNSFQLFKSKQGWKIISVLDTRRKHNC